MAVESKNRFARENRAKEILNINYHIKKNQHMFHVFVLPRNPLFSESPKVFYEKLRLILLLNRLRNR
jgi:hypothetical protein